MTHLCAEPRVQANGTGRAPGLIAALAVALWASGCHSLRSQTLSECGPDGYRVVTRSWDAVLNRGWESRQQCAHPERPLRFVSRTAMQSGESALSGSTNVGSAVHVVSAPSEQPLLVRAGDAVRLWMQDETVRIEMAGTVERSAHQGERVVVQITRQDDDAGLRVQRISGTVSGVDEVEMER